MSELDSYNMTLLELQIKRKEKEMQFVRLFDKLSVQQSKFLIEDIKELDNDIKLVKNKILSLRRKGSDN